MAVPEEVVRTSMHGEGHVLGGAVPRGAGEESDIMFDQELTRQLF